MAWCALPTSAIAGPNFDDTVSDDRYFHFPQEKFFIFCQDWLTISKKASLNMTALGHTLRMQRWICLMSILTAE
jgi:hypothetical protein